MKVIQRLAILEYLLVFLIYIHAEKIDPCQRNDHFTDPKYTCCASVRYDSPGIYTDQSLSNKCLKAATTDQIVHSLWSYYRCLWEEKIGKDIEISFDTIREELGKNLPAKIQADIKSHMEELSKSHYNFDPFAGKAEMKPFTTLAKAWNAYYTAENWACNNQTMYHKTWVEWEEKNSCLTWIQQSFKRGSCCNNFPIPLELFSETYLGIDKFELKNFTATKFMTLAGNYKFQNATLVSQSATNAACRRAALLVKQGVLNMDFVKTWATSRADGTYDTIMQLIIPKYLTLSSLRDKIINTAKQSSGLKNNEDIRLLSNFSIDGQNFPFVKEWKNDDKFSLNGTRLLLWHCNAVQLAVTSYKNLNVADLCFTPPAPAKKDPK